MSSQITVFPVFAANGIHLMHLVDSQDKEGKPKKNRRLLFVLSPEQLLLLAALRRGQVRDPGAVLGYPPDRRRNSGGSERRTPAQRAALSRALRRLAEWGLTTRRAGGSGVRLTEMGQDYADWLLSMVAQQAAGKASLPWMHRVAAGIGVAKVG